MRRCGRGPPFGRPTRHGICSTAWRRSTCPPTPSSRPRRGPATSCATQSSTSAGVARGRRPRYEQRASPPSHRADSRLRTLPRRGAPLRRINLYEQLLDTPCDLRFDYPEVTLQLASVGNLLLIAGTNEALEAFRTTAMTVLVPSLDEYLARF